MNKIRMINTFYDDLILFNRLVYSRLISLRFKEVGKNFRISYPSNIKGGEYIYIGAHVRLMRGLRLQAYDSYKNSQKFSPQILIGDSFNCGENVHIGAIDSIIIGKNVLFGSRIYVTDHQHGNISEAEKDIVPLKRDLFSKGPVIIEDNVFVGDGVVILPGVRIGKGAIIGANSVVTHDVPENAVVGGCPAHIIRML